MECPVCKTDLLMSERQGIEVDYCPKCRGVWLDRGELDKIIERSQAAPAPASDRGRQAAPAGRDYSHGYSENVHGGKGHAKRRRKNFLSEIFDFD